MSPRKRNGVSGNVWGREDVVDNACLASSLDALGAKEIEEAAIEDVVWRGCKAGLDTLL
jgi:hypothetical protein